MPQTTSVKKPLLFDLDGTLTDPKIGITRSIQHALERLDCDAPEMEDLLWCIGPPLQNSFAQLVGDQRVNDAMTYFRERFATVGLFENTPYPGIHQILERISREHQLFVASSKPKVFVDKILEHFELRHFFTDVYGSELDGTRSDKTELIAFALTNSNIQPESAIMIGDRKHDIIGAHNNGLASIGVLYGYGSQEELVAAGANQLARSPLHLAELLSG